MHCGQIQAKKLMAATTEVQLTQSGSIALQSFFVSDIHIACSGKQAELDLRGGHGNMTVVSPGAVFGSVACAPAPLTLVLLCACQMECAE